MKECENCTTLHDGSYGSGRFCSNFCARAFVAKSASNQMKTIHCVDCNTPIQVKKRSSKTVKCDNCSLVKRVCTNCNNDFEVTFSKRHQQFCSRSCSTSFNMSLESVREMVSKGIKAANCGGHISKKAMYYKCKDGSEIYLQSSYEVEVAKELDKNEVKWMRPAPIIWIDQNGSDHRYYPDFYLIDYDVYLDPKNDFLIKKDQDKINRVCIQNNVKVFILNKDELTWKVISSKI